MNTSKVFEEYPHSCKLFMCYARMGCMLHKTHQATIFIYHLFISKIKRNQIDQFASALDGLCIWMIVSHSCTLGMRWSAHLFFLFSLF